MPHRLGGRGASRRVGDQGEERPRRRQGVVAREGEDSRAPSPSGDSSCVGEDGTAEGHGPCQRRRARGPRGERRRQERERIGGDRPSGCSPGLTATSGSVTLLPDLLDEPNEFFTVTLSSPLSATLGSPTAAVIRLADDDPAPTTQLQAAAYTAPEAAPSLRFTATLSAASGQTVTVAYGTTNGTAAAGQDYTAAAGQLTFSPGLTETSSVLTLLPDNNVEPDETFTVTLSSPANATLGAPAAASVTLTDDDLPTTQFSTLAFSAGETSAALPFTVTLNTAASFTVTVAYSTADGTALAGSDYVAATGTLNFPPGATAVTGTVTILPDELYEPNESFALNLSAPVSTTLGGLTSATATILNDDGLPTAAFTAADYSQTEISATAAVTVQLSAPAGITVSVSYATTPETATPGADYAPSSGTLTFAPGMTQTLGLVLLAGDSLDEADETLFFSLSAPVNATLGAPSTTRLSILDDDAPPSVQWQTGSSSAPESAGSAVFTATLSAASGLTVTVPYSLSGSATGGVDYSLPAGSLSFAPGLTAAALHPSLTADAEIEGDETLIVTLATPTNAALGAPAAHTLTILDVSAPPPTVQWSAAAYTATEESGALTLTATLSAASGLTVTVVYSATPGTALPSADYAPLSGTLTFAPGQTQRPVTLTLTNDSLPEPAEGLTLTLSSPVNATLGLPTAATVTIADADQFSIYLPLSFGPPAPAGGFAGRPHERQRHPALRPHLRHAQH